MSDAKFLTLVGLLLIDIFTNLQWTARIYGAVQEVLLTLHR